MASIKVSTHVVDSALVVVKVLVDGEGSLNGSVGLDLGLDRGDTARDLVGRLGKVLVLGVGIGVSRLAGLGALGGWENVRWALVVVGSVVVSTWWDRVGLASLVVEVGGSGDDSF